MFGFKVICWALLFIFKLRFPPGVSIATLSRFNKKAISAYAICHRTIYDYV